MQIFVIGDHSTCLAFSLGGITTRTVKGREKTVAALQFAVHPFLPCPAKVLPRIAALVRPEMDKILYTMHRPLVVEIPDTTGSLPDRPSAGELMMSLMRQ